MTAALIGTNLGYIVLTFIPPILWLIFYLQEDRHPEPKHLLLLTFIGGMGSAFLALAGECGWIFILSGSCTKGIASDINPYLLFFGIAFIEEYVKYLVVKTLIMRRPEFDEPIDAMIYMMTSALGFAALENLLFLFPLFHQSMLAGLEVTANRFLGANLLHALSSGIVGFFLARAFFSKYRHHFVALGLLVATLLHTAFNSFILVMQTSSDGVFYIIFLLATMTVMVFVDFERLKKTDTPPPSPSI